jgi:hypothetical protein
VDDITTEKTPSELHIPVKISLTIRVANAVVSPVDPEAAIIHGN